MNIPYSAYIYPQEHLEPDELAMGQAAMNFDIDCDFIIVIGSGTLNDIGKMLAKITRPKIHDCRHSSFHGRIRFQYLINDIRRA
jgi:hypothetical protein